MRIHLHWYLVIDMASHILLLFIMKGLWKLMLVVLPMGFLPPSWFSVDSCAFDCTNLENLIIAKKCWIVLPWEMEKKSDICLVV